MSASVLEWEFEMTPLMSALTTFVVFVIGLRVVKIIFTDENDLKNSTHNWRNTTSFSGGSCCNECKRLIISGEGKFCDSCGIFGDLFCLPLLNKTTTCKAISISGDEPMKHHWVRGNLKPLSTCDVCDDDCSLTAQLKHYKCCWCLRTVHQGCRPNVAEVCDFGPYRNLIIPPTSIEIVSKRSNIRKKEKILIKPVDWPGWTPLLILANCRSGSNEGEDILSKFRAYLNPGQVMDLGRKKPEVALEWCTALENENVQMKILVAGGDGTVGWVLNTISKLDLTNQPAVGIIPLGTGNDLSRVLGWGKSTSSSFSVSSVLNAVLKAEIVPFDRWRVVVRSNKTLRGLPKHLFMYNYLSIGVDAQVTLDFHNARESPFYIYGNRLINKLLYLSYGTQQMIEKKCQGLNERLELYLDGKKMHLPAIESIVVLNIDSWGAGVNLWKMSKTDKDETKQSYSDGKLEVLAIYSSLHIAQLQVGLGAPYRVGQARTVEIKLNSACAVQVDGEPWFQHPATFTINHFNQALVMKKW